MGFPAQGRLFISTRNTRRDARARSGVIVSTNAWEVIRGQPAVVKRQELTVHTKRSRSGSIESVQQTRRMRSAREEIRRMRSKGKEGVVQLKTDARLRKPRKWQRLRKWRRKDLERKQRR